MSEPLVRPRRPQDVSALCVLLAEQQPSSGYPYRWPLPMPVEQFVVRPYEQAAWVAELAGVPVGHVSVGSLEVFADQVPATVRIGAPQAGVPGAAQLRAATGCPDPAVVSVLFTGLGVRGRGVGAALLEVAVAWARERGRVPVLDVLPTHAAAVELYRRRGWVQVGAARFDWLPAHVPDVQLMALPPFARAPRPTLAP